MSRLYVFGIFMLVACVVLEVSSFPSNNDASVQYLPFYGGGKGQYLEVTKDTTGRITSQKIVAEENINSENVLKNNDGNLIAKVMAANLQNLKTLSTNLLKLTNVGRKSGVLSASEKTRFKSQLTSLGESASNIIKLIDEVDDIDMLFKKNSTLRKADYDDDDYVVEEGVGIETSNDDGIGSDLDQATIAEAKPVGLAIIGTGLASSRPMGTAIASSGVAIAKPIATAIAGVDPAALGISLQLTEYSKRKA